jgi:hypothetical protein
MNTVYIIKLSVIGARLFNDLIIIDDSRSEQITSEADDWSSITIERIIDKIVKRNIDLSYTNRFIVANLHSNYKQKGSK